MQYIEDTTHIIILMFSVSSNNIYGSEVTQEIGEKIYGVIYERKQGHI